MPRMQAAVLWSVIAALVLASAAALVRQWQLLRAARERERLLERQLTHASGFALAGPLATSALQDIATTLDRLARQSDAARALAQRGELEALQQPLAELGAGSVRARDALRNLLALLTPRERGHEVFDANDMAAEAVQLFAPEAARRGIELVLLPCAGRAGVQGERGELQLALLQLVANALEAMQSTPAAHRRVLVSTHVTNGGVELTVSDRGDGLGERRPETFFSPYYTTRQGHMGLGLPVARRIVEAHEGRIEARRRAGGGAVFTVTLPRRGMAGAAEPAAARSSSFPAPCVVQP